MSVLIHESAINPAKNLWASASTAASFVTGTVAGTTYPIPLLANSNNILNTISLNKGAGTYVVTGCFQLSTNNSATTTLRGYLDDTVSGSVAQCGMVSNAASTYSISCVISITTTTNVVLRQYVVPDQNGNSTGTGQWSIVFYPA